MPCSVHIMDEQHRAAVSSYMLAFAHYVSHYEPHYEQRGHHNVCRFAFHSWNLCDAALCGSVWTFACRIMSRIMCVGIPVCGLVCSSAYRIMSRIMCVGIPVRGLVWSFACRIMNRCAAALCVVVWTVRSPHYELVCVCVEVAAIDVPLWAVSKWG